jgi:hypothetical protein
LTEFAEAVGRNREDFTPNLQKELAELVKLEKKK